MQKMQNRIKNLSAESIEDLNLDQLNELENVIKNSCFLIDQRKIELIKEREKKI